MSNTEKHIDDIPESAIDKEDRATEPNPNNSKSFYEVFRVFLSLGLTSFGGPVAHLGYFRRTLVEERKWLSEDQYAQLVAICQFLPGPASSQVGFALGLFKAGWSGAFAAFLGFTLPSLLILVGFALALPVLPNELVEPLVHGLKLVACVVVLDAVWGMYQKLCVDMVTRLIAILGACFLLLNIDVSSQLLVILVAGFVGWLFCRPEHNQSEFLLPVRHGAKLGGLFLAAFVSVFLLLALFGMYFDWAATATGFYQAGALVFGGGHVVLPWLEQLVVASGQMSAESFLAGYGAAQAVPGPLFTFAAYLGAVLGEGWSSVLLVLVCVTAIFLPGFLLLLAFLPFWHRFSAYPQASYALAGVNAGVVGILGAVLYDPIFTTAVSTNTDVVIVLLGLLLLKVVQMPIVWVVASMVLSTFVLI